MVCCFFIDGVDDRSWDLGAIGEAVDPYVTTCGVDEGEEVFGVVC